MKIYTRTGDAGDTGLFGGERVSKTSARVGAYGSVDEANAHLGMARATLHDAEIDELLGTLQSDLFDVGADLATKAGVPARERIHPSSASDVARIEAWIDRLEGELAPLRSFILPGGHPAAATLHVARTVVRRAERDAVALAEAEEANPHAVVYLNRLSDLLFVLARVVNARHGVDEATWSAGARADASDT
ncbi:MAG: cob(I)yrinic acid a,c-diamide adenosyltransferase [Trueperaceae bacterium]|nr:cob(I)yrinic acid a,c-diamide adenosyltransferase [Trueperaceae bacterium]